MKKKLFYNIDYYDPVALRGTFLSKVQKKKQVASTWTADTRVASAGVAIALQSFYFLFTIAFGMILKPVLC